MACKCIVSLPQTREQVQRGVIANLGLLRKNEKGTPNSGRGSSGGMSLCCPLSRALVGLRAGARWRLKSLELVTFELWWTGPGIPFLTPHTWINTLAITQLCIHIITPNGSLHFLLAAYPRGFESRNIFIVIGYHIPNVFHIKPRPQRVLYKFFLAESIERKLGI